jgi:predicted transcriptional regulator of viral defense system
MWTNKKTEKKLLEIAQKQGGYFTSGQALKAGYSYRLQSYHKEQKHWVEIERGLFRIANFIPSQFDDLIRWSLWSRDKKGNPQAVISHESALVVHELGDVLPAKVHITVPVKFRKDIPNGIIYHKGNIKPGDIEMRDDFSVTTPIRTIIDVAEENISLEQLEQIVRDGLDKGLIRPVQFQKVHMSTKARSKISTVLVNVKKNPF